MGSNPWIDISPMTMPTTWSNSRSGTTVRNPAVSKDVYLDLTEATLQVTFEYDE